MKALALLSREHAAIGALLGRLERELAEATRSGEVDAEAIDRLQGFFEHVVEGHHQEKEERLFLPCLLTRATGAELELLRTVAREHSSQRRALEHMRGQLEGAAYQELFATAALVREGRAFVRRQREHSRWEERVLFTLARRRLSPEDDRLLAADLRREDELRRTTVWEAACAVAEWLDRRRPLPLPA